MNPDYFAAAPHTTMSDLTHPPVMYSDPSFCVAPAMPVYYDRPNMPFPRSPESLMSVVSPSPSPLQGPGYEPPMLVASSSSSTTNSAVTTACLSLTKPSPQPNALYPEFLQYSKETFEHPQPKKRRCEKEGKDEEADDGDNVSEKGSLSTAELRRQIHIQSEQKRRAEIKDGFEDLRNELPANFSKKMSKVALLRRTVQHIQHLKSTQTTILAELQRLCHENEQLRRFQQGVLQTQALGNMYTVSNM